MFVYFGPCNDVHFTAKKKKKKQEEIKEPIFRKKKKVQYSLQLLLKAILTKIKTASFLNVPFPCSSTEI